VANVVAASATHILEWLAISLMPGLGPTKARKLVAHFGSAEAVFHASLTELEGTGIQAVSAQSIATGKSAELAREGDLRPTAGALCSGQPRGADPARHRHGGHAPSHAVWLGMAERLAGDLAAQGLVIISSMARGVDTAAIAGQSRPREDGRGVWHGR
jgi:DNA processing protein